MPADLSKDLLLHHPELDRQHADLFAQLEAASEAFDLGTRTELLAALAHFTDVYLAHCAEEERLMEGSLFPDRGRHRMAHEVFTADLERLRQELELAGPTPVIGEWLKIRLPEWLRFHVAVNDAKVAQHLAAQPRRQGRPTRRSSRGLA
jgi:hemerythrin-like metal-binding protein